MYMVSSVTYMVSSDKERPMFCSDKDINKDIHVYMCLIHNRFKIILKRSQQ